MWCLELLNQSINNKEQQAYLFAKTLHLGQFKYILSKLNISNIYVKLEGEYQVVQ